ncbi:hypothetical protein EIP86_009239 [Pleurotus ostreatoroseus]|nr:hypothetical protein EIP86_009239 [Pleurotus ostreatoroseus]
MPWQAQGGSMSALVAIALVLSTALYAVARGLRVHQRLPPGPPSGYLGKGRFDMPAEPYRRFKELAAEYGTIFSFRLGHTPVIVINTAKAAWDLLEKRGEIYSSRPRNIMGQEILSRDNWGLGMAYGEKWRRWRKAQDELDAVVGQTRMPTFDDESSLPYVNAMIKESLRWLVVAPIGLPHATTAEDEYMGYRIPQGSTVWANINSISHDPALFLEPEEFNPERFLNPSDPRLVDFDLPFGFGRRICPGKALAMQSLFIVISRILWAFHIEPETDADGNPVYPDPNASTSNVTRRPQQFACVLRPRSNDIADMIHEEAQRAEETLKEWEQ